MWVQVLLAVRKVLCIQMYCQLFNINVGASASCRVESLVYTVNYSMLMWVQVLLAVWKVFTVMRKRCESCPVPVLWPARTVRRGMMGRPTPGKIATTCCTNATSDLWSKRCGGGGGGAGLHFVEFTVWSVGVIQPLIVCNCALLFVNMIVCEFESLRPWLVMWSCHRDNEYM